MRQSGVGNLRAREVNFFEFRQGGEWRKQLVIQRHAGDVQTLNISETGEASGLLARDSFERPRTILAIGQTPR